MQVALLRGINVGRAKRVAMADLRALMADLGYGAVRTVLNSGNVVYRNAQDTSAAAAVRIEQALGERLGVSARVTVITAHELARVVAANPLLEMADNPSRLLVAFMLDADDCRKLEPLLATDWSPEALALGERVAYLWCPTGVLASRLPVAVGAALGEGTTTRNWATVQKLYALLTNPR